MAAIRALAHPGIMRLFCPTGQPLFGITEIWNSAMICTLHGVVFAIVI
jgi:hypothetical protein